MREPCAYAGAVVAHRRSIDHAQVAISTARTEWSVIGLVALDLGGLRTTAWSRSFARPDTSRDCP